MTVGTWRAGYDRLIKAVDELVGSGVITDEVVAQTGNSSYRPKYMTVMEFCSPDEFVNLISRAELVISHAGMGTIIEAVKQTKPIVVMPRKPALGEIDNDHQFTTAKQLEKEGKILVAYEVSDLPVKLEQAKTFVPAKIQEGQSIIKAVQEFIDSLAIKKRR
ncbi:MAG: hypothetical protein KAT56_08475 [Sedimentisphaerales bacterium]|nr:hypothetical protein [Sedimentisphaerales bacterium]